MKKIVSTLIILIFVCAVFFVFADVSYSKNMSATDYPRPNVSISAVPLPTLAIPVNIPDPNLKAALHEVTGVPPGNPILRSDLSALTLNLNLNGKGISDIEGLQFCNNIQGLFLSNNDLYSLTSSLGGLTSLKKITLENNHFSALPNELYAIPNLRTIVISDNPILSIQSGISAVSSLRALSIDGCLLNMIPPALLYSNLEWLDISNNDIVSIPLSISNMTNLTSFKANEIGLDEFPSGLLDMPWMQVLELADNNIEQVPDGISNMLALQYLILKGNKLQHLPTEIFELPLMQTLNVSGNRLYTLPGSIGSSSITNLSLRENRINSLPSAIGASNLTFLDVSVNRLTSLPATLSDLPLGFCRAEFNFLDVSPGSPALAVINSIAGTVEWERQLTPVTNLTAVATDSQITLSWDACPSESQNFARWDVIQYVIYLNDNGLEKLDELTPSELSYKHIDLAPDEAHEYWVGVDYHVVFVMQNLDTDLRSYTVIEVSTNAAESPPPATPSASAVVSLSLDNSTDEIASEAGTAETAQEQATNEASDDVKAVSQESEPRNLPVWVIVLICVLGVELLVAGGFFGWRAYKKNSKPTKRA